MENSKQGFRRQIRSFVSREGRLTAGQEQAIKTGWPLFGLDKASRLDMGQVFGNDNPVTLEIGFGNGASLAEMALESPDRNFIGIEVHTPGVGHLLRLILENNIQNIRLFDCDAIEVLKLAIADESLDRVQLFFPDPWHKKRHHKRRIVQKSFLDTLNQKLAKGGCFHAATDWENYAEHMLAVLNEHPAFSNTAEEDYIPRPKSRPLTKFEKRGQRLGHGVWDLVFQKD